MGPGSQVEVTGALLGHANGLPWRWWRLKECQGNGWRDLAVSPEEEAELQEAAPGWGGGGVHGVGSSVDAVGRGGESGGWVGEI